jgi:hypothetical protein
MQTSNINQTGQLAFSNSHRWQLLWTQHREANWVRLERFAVTALLDPDARACVGATSSDSLREPLAPTAFLGDLTPARDKILVRAFPQSFRLRLRRSWS